VDKYSSNSGLCMEPVINGRITIRKGLETWGLPPLVIFCLFLCSASGGTGLFRLHRPPSSGGGSFLPSLARSACRMRMRKRMRMSPPRRMRSGWFMPPPWFVSSPPWFVSPQTTISMQPIALYPWFGSQQTIYLSFPHGLCPHKPSTSR
jgi:hypothetical protein